MERIRKKNICGRGAGGRKDEGEQRRAGGTEEKHTTSGKSQNFVFYRWGTSPTDEQMD